MEEIGESNKYQFEFDDSILTVEVAPRGSVLTDICKIIRSKKLHFQSGGLIKPEIKEFIEYPEKSFLLAAAIATVNDKIVACGIIKSVNGKKLIDGEKVPRKYATYMFYTQYKYRRRGIASLLLKLLTECVQESYTFPTDELHLGGYHHDKLSSAFYKKHCVSLVDVREYS